MGDYVMNSASLSPPHENREAADNDVISLFVALAGFERDEEYLPALRLSGNPWTLCVARAADGRELSMGELVHALYGGPFHDVAAFFDSLIMLTPAEAELSEDEVDALLRIAPTEPTVGLETSFDRVQMAGLESVLCAVISGVMVSLQRGETWDLDRMGFRCDGAIYGFDHVANETHSAAVQLRRRNSVRAMLTSRQFWSMKNRAFPNLVFGRDVEGQVAKFSAKLLPLLFRRLAELDGMAHVWQVSGAQQPPLKPLQITPETPETMARYGNERHFRDSDGSVKTYEDHVWIDQGHRIHLIKQSNARKFEIGYVGPHLPTMKYRT